MIVLVSEVLYAKKRKTKEKEKNPTKNPLVVHWRETISD